MDALFFCIFAVFGLIIGSFLNVVIYRFNTTKTLGGRSLCLNCGRTLKWHDLVPFFSYVFLRGRCYGCKTKISIQYPIVELLTAILFMALYHKYQIFFFADMTQFAVLFVYYAVAFALLLIITVYDIRHKIIPDRLSLVFGLVAFVGIFFIKNGFVFFHWPTFSDFLGGLVISVPFALLWLVSYGRWMGLGDAKLAVGLGLLLGTWGVLLASMFAFWAGAIIGILLLVFRKLTRGLKSEIPFAPFLVFGTVLVFFFSIGLPLFF